MQKFGETSVHPLQEPLTPPPTRRRLFSIDEVVNTLNTPKHYYGKRQIVYPYNEEGRLAGREVTRDNHRHDERLTIELLNAPLSVPIPRVDMVILYYKALNAMELSRVKSFHGALICNGGLRINLFRDNEGGFFFAKLYIPYEVLHEQSDFKFADESQYTTVQRVYAIQKIINKTVVLSKFHTDEHYERYDYRRLFNDNIIAGSYVPHEPKVQEELLHNWAMIKNLLNPQPIEKIKEYCGAQVAIHFAWSAYFNVSLLLGAFFGLASYACSLVVTHWQYDYSIEEVCAGVYDYYPRCPLCATCNYSSLSDTCSARRKLRRSSNIIFCILTSFLVSGLLTSFKNYIRNLTSSWEEPNTRHDVAIHHLTMTSRTGAPLKDSAAIEPIRIEYLKKFPSLMDVYDLAVKPRIDFEEMTNVCLTHIEPRELDSATDTSTGGGFSSSSSTISSGEQSSPTPRSSTPRASDEIVSINDHTPEHSRIAENSRDLFETITLTPAQFQEVSSRVTADDEFGFVMTPTRNSLSTSGGDSSTAQLSPGAGSQTTELAETLSQHVAMEQDEAVYQIRGLQALLHCLVAWLMTVIFFFYFVLIVIIYLFFLSKFDTNVWYVQPMVNSVLNIIFRMVNSKVVWYLTLYQVPKYESQFNKWLAQKLMALFYTEYALFFYTAIYAQFHFTNPGKLKNPPYNLKPCDEDDCHYTLATRVGKILTVDQVSFLFTNHIWPVIPNKMWGCSFCENAFVNWCVSATYRINSFRNRVVYQITRFFWSVIFCQTKEPQPLKKTYAVGNNKGTWYTDGKLLAYTTQPYMYSQYLIILKMLGYVALFGANWFMAPFVLYLVSLVYIRIHATHVLTNYRRPIPERAKSLGVWNKYIDNMVLMSFVCTGFTFAFLSGVVPQTIHLMREGTLAYYMNTTLSFFDTKTAGTIFKNAYNDRDYCIYNGNMEPPWAKEPFTLSSIGCFRLFYKLVFFVIYGGVFHGICRWLRFDLVDLFDILYDMTVSVASPLFKVLNNLVTPAPYVRKDSIDGSNPFIQKPTKIEEKKRNLSQKVLHAAKKRLFKKGDDPKVIDIEEHHLLSPQEMQEQQRSGSSSTHTLPESSPDITFETALDGSSGPNEEDEDTS